jgi:hypothetical protein
MDAARESTLLSEGTLGPADIVKALEEILHGAKAGEAWAPAIRAAELLGKRLNMWHGDDGPPQLSLAELIRQAAAEGAAEEGPIC